MKNPIKMSRAEEEAIKRYPKIGSYDNLMKRKGFIEGYHQAEKDIGDPISWIKEISREKEMTRAEEEALKAYPPRSIAANYDTINRRDAFEYGYIKAEKDFTLTWEDMMLIHRCIKDAMNYHLYKMMEGVEGQKVVYQEVLKRFKDFKEKKEK